MTTTIERCPFCNSEQPTRGWPFAFAQNQRSWQVFCPQCRARGPEHTHVDDAHAAWTRALQKHPREKPRETPQPYTKGGVTGFPHGYKDQP